jgi:hypothetical protein
MNGWRDQRASEKCLDDLQYIPFEDEAKNVFVTIMKLVISSGTLNEWYATCGEPLSFVSNTTTKFHGVQSFKIVHWTCRSLGSKFPEQRSRSIDIIILT